MHAHWGDGEERIPGSRWPDSLVSWHTQDSVRDLASKTKQDKNKVREWPRRTPEVNIWTSPTCAHTHKKEMKGDQGEENGVRVGDRG